MPESETEFTPGSYKNTGTYPVELADGRIVPVGEFRVINEKQIGDEGNQLHITEGRLTLSSEEASQAEVTTQPEAAKETTGKKGGS